MMKEEYSSEKHFYAMRRDGFCILNSYFNIGRQGKSARVTAAIAKQTTVAAFRPWRDL